MDYKGKTGAIIKFQGLGGVAEWLWHAIAKRTGGGAAYNARIALGGIKVVGGHDRAFKVANCAMIVESRILIQAPTFDERSVVFLRYEGEDNNQLTVSIPTFNQPTMPYDDSDIHLDEDRLEIIADKLTGKIWGA